jgi:hypothetical protein
VKESYRSQEDFIKICHPAETLTDRDGARGFDCFCAHVGRTKLPLSQNSRYLVDTFRFI